MPDVFEAREKESKKAPPDRGKARRQRDTMQVGKDGSAFSRKTVHSNKQRGNLIQQKDEQNAKVKSVGIAPCVQCKREASRTRRAIGADRSANDIAKQVTMTSVKVMSTREEK